MHDHWPRLASLRDAKGLRARLSALSLELPCDDAVLPAPSSPLAQPLVLRGLHPAPRTVANRFVIQPMEGWDGTPEGGPSELTLRRWRNFGRSRAAWIWGGEAVAVRADGRANPHQLLMSDGTAAAIGGLRQALLAEAREHQGDPVVGLQLTHSGRWSKPAANQQMPRVAFRHSLLDHRSGVSDDGAVMSDADVAALVPCFAEAARLASEEGFDFVDLKHCHGYLLHEFLAARHRTGRYGGASLEERTQLLQELIAVMRDAAPHMPIAVRLSVFDCVPHHAEGVGANGRPGPGVPDWHRLPYDLAFGLAPRTPTEIDLAEPIALARLLHRLGVTLLNVTAGSPYYVPHVQRPAAFPPSDGYALPEDPLVGVARLLHAARAMKAAVPEMIVVSSGWSYLQDYLPCVAQACVRDGWFDAVGLGRMALAYPELPADVLAGRPLDRRRVCRTFSDCTTAPRNGLVSGCYPLDPFYRVRPERAELERVKRAGVRSGEQ